MQHSIDIKLIDQHFSITGQISPDDLAEIAQRGFKTIVNFRPDGEGGDSQPASTTLAEKAAGLGLAYVHIPVIPNQIQPDQVDKLNVVLEQQPHPILGFCRTGNRAQSVYQQAIQKHPINTSCCNTQKPACCQAPSQQTGIWTSLRKRFKR